MDKKTIRHDWHALKQEFILSEYKTTSSFFQDKYGTYTGTMKTKSTGWAKEKHDISTKILSNSIKKTIEQQSDDIASQIAHSQKAFTQSLIHTINNIHLSILNLTSHTGFQKEDMKFLDSYINILDKAYKLLPEQPKHTFTEADIQAEIDAIKRLG